MAGATTDPGCQRGRGGLLGAELKVVWIEFRLDTAIRSQFHGPFKLFKVKIDIHMH